MIGPKPTEEQDAAIEYEGNAVVTALPGSGKTFTLARMIHHQVEGLPPYQGVIAISYTNKASDELRARCQGLGATSHSSFFGTIDSFCVAEIIVGFHHHLTGKYGDIEIVENKQFAAWEGILALPHDSIEFRDSIVLAIERGTLPLDAIPYAASIILGEVKECQNYLSSRYAAIFIDEYQDCGAVQHGLVLRLAELGLRAVVVGDPDQSIFAFSGKSSRYLLELMKDDGFKHFEITQSRRCDPMIMRAATALLTEKEQEPINGQCKVIVADIEGGYLNIIKQIEGYLPGITNKYEVDDISKTAILASNNSNLNEIAGIISMPFKLHARTPLDTGMGSWRTIFRELLKLYYSPGRYPADFINARLGERALPQVKNTLYELVSSFLITNESALSDNIKLVEDIAVLCDADGRKNSDVEAYRKTVADLDLLHGGYRPARSGEINLMTYHKSKGLEFDTVFLLDCYEGCIPKRPKWNDKGDSYSQGKALLYVGLTRAKKVAYIVQGSHSQASWGYTTTKPSPLLSIPAFCHTCRHVKWPPQQTSSA